MIPVLKPTVFNSDVVAGFTLKDPAEANSFDFSSKNNAQQALFAELLEQENLVGKKVCVVQQVHADVVVEVTDPNMELGQADALITNRTDVVLGVLVADCGAILLHDPVHSAVAVVHSGWRGSALNIVGKTISKMQETYGTNPIALKAWIGPLAQQASYEVGLDVYEKFNTQYFIKHTDTTWLFDNRAVIADQLLAAGLDAINIESSNLDSVSEESIHSARRDGQDSGRNLAYISIKRTSN